LVTNGGTSVRWELCVLGSPATIHPSTNQTDRRPTSVITLLRVRGVLFCYDPAAAPPLPTLSALYLSNGFHRFSADNCRRPQSAVTFCKRRAPRIAAL